MPVSRSNKLNGTAPSMPKSITVKRLGRTLSLLCALSLLTACATTRGTVTAGNTPNASKARCSGWRPIDYSASGDTRETIDQVRVHNQTGVNKKCWRPGQMWKKAP